MEKEFNIKKMEIFNIMAIGLIIKQKGKEFFIIQTKKNIILVNLVVGLVMERVNYLKMEILHMKVIGQMAFLMDLEGNMLQMVIIMKEI